MSADLSEHAKNHLAQAVINQGLPSPDIKVHRGKVTIYFQDPAFLEIPGLKLHKEFELHELMDPTGLANAASSLVSTIRVHRNVNY